ncbi:MAG: dihydroorotate dehydrogenase [Candidatus Omnitrophica bacterium]|nr:dihydroorotate dehydrogenase [Candidatus Omnitrophota bacterium]
MNLSVKVGDLYLKTPIICASGTFGLADELKDLVDYSAIGAVVSKTITLKPQAGNPPPRIYELPAGVINSIGLENPGIDLFIKEKLKKFVSLPTKHIVSVGGFEDKEYIICVEKLESFNKIDAFEINLSCPNIKLKKLISCDAKHTLKLLRSLRKLTKKPIIAKITAEVTDIVEIAKAIYDAGADAVSLVNTFFALAINIETKKTYLGNVYGGYSGLAIKPIALYKVWKIAKNIDIPIIGGGGIKEAKDAIEFILAGAVAISLGTINLTEPNKAVEILEGMKDYMKRKNIKDIKNLRGGLIV